MTGLFQGLQLVGKLTERRLSLKVQEIFFPFWSQQPTIIPGEFVFLKINAFYFGKQLIVARCPSVHHFAVMDVSSFFALAHESCAHKILHPQDIAWKCGHAKMKDLRAAHNNFRSDFFSCSTFQVPARAGIVPSTHNYGLVAYHSSTSTDTSTSTSNSTCSLLSTTTTGHKFFFSLYWNSIEFWRCDGVNTDQHTNIDVLYKCMHFKTM